MALTDKQRRHLERRLREERAQIVRILDRYQDEQSATPDARVKDLESVDWRQLRGLWDGSPADWNHMARAVSGFLTRLLGDIYHPERRAIVKRIPREKETKRRPSFPGGLFWQIVSKTPEHARPCYVILGATGMRTGEFLAAEARCDRTVPGGSSNSSAISPCFHPSRS